MNPIIYTPDDLLSIGLSMVGIDVARQERQKRETNVDDYTANFGVVPLVHAQIWEDLQPREINNALIETTIPNCIRIELFLLAFYFLKSYSTEKQLKGLTKKTEKTGSKWLWFILGRIQALKDTKVRGDV
jgi:hypothetical protein